MDVNMKLFDACYIEWCLRKGYEYPKPLKYQENFYNLSYIVHTFEGWLSAMVKPTHELGMTLMSKRNEGWNGIMDSMVKINEKDMKVWFIHLKDVLYFVQLHMFEAIICYQQVWNTYTCLRRVYKVIWMEISTKYGILSVQNFYSLFPKPQLWGCITWA